jgi:hypothetical protein
MQPGTALVAVAAATAVLVSGMWSMAMVEDNFTVVPKQLTSELALS